MNSYLLLIHNTNWKEMKIPMYLLLSSLFLILLSFKNERRLIRSPICLSLKDADQLGALGRLQGGGGAG
jgi:hypothetical protein